MQANSAAHNTGALTYFVGRHTGSRDWIQQKGVHIDHFVEHLDIAHTPKAGDTVIGTLPVHLVAALNKKGVKFLHLALTIDADIRGQELSAQQVEQLAPRLDEYLVIRLNQHDT